MANEQVTGTRDEHYDLISVLYHATHGAWNYDQYVDDAQQAGDEELAQFFRDVKEQNRQRSEHAKQLLATRLS
jgi:rubrerythrin